MVRSLGREERTRFSRRLTKQAQEWDEHQFLLSHDGAMCGVNPANGDNIHIAQVVAHEDCGSAIEPLLSLDVELDTEWSGSKERKASRCEGIRQVALPENGANERDEDSNSRHEHTRDHEHNVFGSELRLLGESGQKSRKYEVEEDR